MIEELYEFRERNIFGHAIWAAAVKREQVITWIQLAQGVMVGINFLYKGINRRVAGMGNQSSIWMCIIFSSKVYQWVSFYSKIYMNRYNVKNYIQVQFSQLSVYEWVCFCTLLSIWMGWVPGTPAVRMYPKSWQKTHPQWICQMENGKKKHQVLLILTLKFH